MVSRQSKASDPSSQYGIKTCFYCSKMGHIAQFCYQAKNKKKNNVKNTMDDDKFVFAMQYKAYLRGVCKWIMNSVAKKHMTLHRAAFDISEVICPHNMRLGYDSVAKIIGVGSIVVGIKMIGIKMCICASYDEFVSQLAFGEKFFCRTGWRYNFL